IGPPSPSAIVHRTRWRAVRHLHARHDHGRPCARAASNPPGHSSGPCRELVPLHRLRRDLPLRSGGRQAAQAFVARLASPRQAPAFPLVQSILTKRRLFEPRTLKQALAMLRDEGRLVPVAGCTDLYVALNFGTLKDTRFLDLWRLDELRGIKVEGG